MENCSLLAVSRCPAFPWSWWKDSARPIGIEMMCLLLHLVGAMVKLGMLISVSLDLCLRGRIIKICPRMLVCSPTGLQQCTKETRVGRYVEYYYVYELKNFLRPEIVYKIHSYQLETNKSLTLLLIQSSLAESSLDCSLVGILCLAMAPSDAQGKNKGCGACGKSAHTFRDCPNKNAQIPTLQLTIKKPSSKKQASEETTPQLMEKGGWNMIGKKNRVVKHSNIAIPNGSIYLSDRSGIKVTYESEDSEEGIQHMLESDEDFTYHTHLLSVAADLHPYNLFSEDKNNSNLNKEKGGSSLTPEVIKVQPRENQIKNVVKGIPPILAEGMRDKDTSWNHTILEPHPEVQQEEVAPIITNTVNTKKSITNIELAAQGQVVFEEGMASDSKIYPKEIVETGCPSLFIEKTGLMEQSLEPPHAIINSNKEISLPQQLDEELSDYYEEQYDYEYDDLLVDELPEIIHPNPLLSLTLNADNPIMISEDPPFSEKDLEEFINNDELDGMGDQLISDGTFHSMQNSIHSSSSFVNGMERLIVHQPDKSTSNSSKRRISEGVEDTATSEKRARKKTKY